MEVSEDEQSQRVGLQILRSSVKQSGAVELRQLYNREKRVCTVSVNQWATNEEKQDEEKCGPFQKLSEQGEQRCSEPSVVCLGEDSQKEESCNNQDMTEQRQRHEAGFSANINSYFWSCLMNANNKKKKAYQGLDVA